MGLTLVRELGSRVGGNIDFVFSVDPAAYGQENIWADHYGLRVVRRDHVVKWWSNSKWPLLIVKRIMMAARKIGAESFKASVADAELIHEEYVGAILDSDVIIDMSGISYVGDGFRGPLEGAISYSTFYYAKKYGKRYVRFIQSIGPFDDWRVRFFAKRELNCLPFVMARGAHSASYCADLVNDKTKVHDYPDIAILLPRNDSWASRFIAKHQLEPHQFTIISPSAVLANARRSTGSTGAFHVESIVNISRRLLKQGHQLVFLPHMYSDDLSECDRNVARKIISELTGKVVLVEEDIDPMMAKALISQARMAIVCRYHALVAALSTGIDVVSLGWNVKYLDLMEYFGTERFAIDARKYDPHALASLVEKKTEEFVAKSNEDGFRAYELKHQNAVAKVNQAFDVLTDWINDAN